MEHLYTNYITLKYLCQNLNRGYHTEFRDMTFSDMYERCLRTDLHQYRYIKLQ